MVEICPDFFERISNLVEPTSLWHPEVDQDWTKFGGNLHQVDRDLPEAKPAELWPQRPNGPPKPQGLCPYCPCPWMSSTNMPRNGTNKPHRVGNDPPEIEPVRPWISGIPDPLGPCRPPPLSIPVRIIALSARPPRRSSLHCETWPRTRPRAGERLLASSEMPVSLPGTRLTSRAGLRLRRSAQRQKLPRVPTQSAGVMPAPFHKTSVTPAILGRAWP